MQHILRIQAAISGNIPTCSRLLGWLKILMCGARPNTALVALPCAWLLFLSAFALRSRHILTAFHWPNDFIALHLQCSSTVLCSTIGLFPLPFTVSFLPNFCLHSLSQRLLFPTHPLRVPFHCLALRVHLSHCLPSPPSNLSPQLMAPQAG